MTNIHSHPTPLRQKFIEYLTLNRKAERTVHCYVSFIYSLAKHCRRSPDLLGHEDIRGWLYYLIAERKQAPSTVNLAINAVRSFYGGLLQREIEPLLHQIKRPRRPALVPRLYSMAEVEKLLTVGTEGNLRARAFLSCVYGGGLRLSEATHIQIKDLDGVRHRLLVSHPKGHRQRYTLLSDNLLTVLRDYYRQAHPKVFLFPGTEPLAPINKATGQNIFYGAVAKARLPDRGGIHSLRQNAECREMPSEVNQTVRTLRDSRGLASLTRHFQRPCKNARSLSPGR